MIDERKITLDPITRAECKSDRTKMRLAYYDVIAEKIGRAAADELRFTMDIYDERIYEWMANLWDPEIGGFYYSLSAREVEGYLPDIESTVQAIHSLETSGILPGGFSGTPEDKRQSMLAFAKSLQDEEDGYFYHPQWGKSVGTSRRGRDLSWATEAIRCTGGKPNYPTPIERAKADAGKAEKTVSTLPDYLKSVDKFREYLESFDLETNSYYVGNLLQSQARQIEAAGEEFVSELFNWYEKYQRSDNGVWQEAVNYHGANGLMKISLTYSHFRRPMKYAKEALKYAIDVAMCDRHIYFCCQFYNPIVTIRTLLDSVLAAGQKDEFDRLYADLIELAPALIKRTREKILSCRREDGSFSYGPDGTSFQSQGAPVALFRELEGDVNSTCISSTGTIRSLCRALYIPKAPFFGRRDREAFLALWDKIPKREKLYPAPKDFFFKSDEEYSFSLDGEF